MRYKYDPDELRKAVIDSYSIAEVCRKLGIKAAGGNYSTLKQRFKEWNIDTSHFRGQGWNVGLKFKPNPRKPLSEILTEESTYQAYKLKKRLLNEGIKIHECENCNLTEWQGMIIPLELHHVNGIRTDNRLKNIKLLCPNCHALTSNYRGKNIRVARREISE